MFFVLFLFLLFKENDDFIDRSILDNKKIARLCRIDIVLPFFVYTSFTLECTRAYSCCYLT